MRTIAPVKVTSEQSSRFHNGTDGNASLHLTYWKLRTRMTENSSEPDDKCWQHRQTHATTKQTFRQVNGR